MSQQSTGVTRTFTAEAAMANPFRIVKLGTSAKQANLATVNSDVCVGVVQHSASADESVTVAVSGTTKLYVSAAVTKGAALVATAAGAGVTATTANTGIIGTALETSTGAGILEVLLTPAVRY